VPSPTATRTFICLDLPDALRVDVEALQRRLAGLGDKVRWVDPRNLHLTLRFLGEISRPQVETVCLAVRCAASRMDAFPIHLSGTGCFPSPRRPRAFWIGVSDASNLIRLFETIERELVSAGFPREARPFSPHLTVGRVRVDRSTARLGEAMGAAEFDAQPFLVAEVTVMKSELRTSGAVYTPIARLSLRKADAAKADKPGKVDA
jgi:RNA 2',3'-cyclic 3'-phosphodiesterase